MYLGQRTLYKVTAVLSPTMFLTGSCIKVLDQIRQRATLHGTCALKLQSTLTIRDDEPADIGVVATFLRAHIGEVFVSHLVLIAAYELAAVAVPIVLVRTTTVVLYPSYCLGICSCIP